MGSQGSCGPSHARRRPRSRPSTVTAPGGARTPREGRGPGPRHKAHTCSSADSRLLSDVRFITSPRALSNLIRGRSFRDTCTCICRDSSITRGPKASAVRLPDSRGSAAPALTHPRTQLPGAQNRVKPECGSGGTKRESQICFKMTKNSSEMSKPEHGLWSQMT